MPREIHRSSVGMLDLLKAGRTVQQIAADLQIGDQAIDNWRRRDRIDSGQEPGFELV